MYICRNLNTKYSPDRVYITLPLEPRNRILLIGPPGNGKTSLAEAYAEALMVSLFVVKYDSLVGAYLGETASRLRKLII